MSLCFAVALLLTEPSPGACLHHAGIDVLQPVIPPTQDFLEESDLGAGKCKVG